MRLLAVSAERAALTARAVARLALVRAGGAAARAVGALDVDDAERAAARARIDVGSARGVGRRAGVPGAPAGPEPAAAAVAAVAADRAARPTVGGGPVRSIRPAAGPAV